MSARSKAAADSMNEDQHSYMLSLIKLITPAVEWTGTRGLQVGMLLTANRPAFLVLCLDTDAHAHQESVLKAVRSGKTHKST